MNVPSDHLNPMLPDHDLRSSPLSVMPKTFRPLQVLEMFHRDGNDGHARDIVRQGRCGQACEGMGYPRPAQGAMNAEEVPVVVHEERAPHGHVGRDGVVGVPGPIDEDPALTRVHKEGLGLVLGTCYPGAVLNGYGRSQLHETDEGVDGPS